MLESLVMNTVQTVTVLMFKIKSVYVQCFMEIVYSCSEMADLQLFYGCAGGNSKDFSACVALETENCFVFGSENILNQGIGCTTCELLILHRICKFLDYNCVLLMTH
jgi:hypothetical protein